MIQASFLIKILKLSYCEGQVHRLIFVFAEHIDTVQRSLERNGVSDAELRVQHSCIVVDIVICVGLSGFPSVELLNNM